MRKQLELVEHTAVRGPRMLVLDVLAVDPALRGRDATAEMQRRARACCRDFGELASDQIIRGARCGIAHRDV